MRVQLVAAAWPECSLPAYCGPSADHSSNSEGAAKPKLAMLD